MSYTSKFTGEEIDNLLSSINTSINYTNQLLPNFFSTPLSSVQLNDNVYNYDFIHVTIAVNGTTGKTFKKTVMIYTKNIKGEDEDEFSIYADTEAGTSTSYAYTFRFGFSQDGKYLLTSYIKKSAGWSNTEIGIDSIIGIKMQSNMIDTCSSNPIGSILPIMGTEAPQDYLVCDGRELQISEYKELADYFEKQFGDNGYFGGDGIKTFKLPDLRNEFLRGYHGDKEEQLSDEIGIHQEPTYHPRPVSGDNNQPWMPVNMNSTTFAINEDTREGESTKRINWERTLATGGTIQAPYITSRPTNVAVLFCIKYTESVSGNGDSNAGENYSTKEQRIGTWIDGKPLYRKVYTFDITSTPTRSFTIIEKDFGLTKQMKRIDGNVYGQSGDWSATYHLGLYHYWKDTTDVFSFLPNVENNDLIIFTQWSVTQNFTVEAVVEYTKTTD